MFYIGYKLRNILTALLITDLLIGNLPLCQIDTSAKLKFFYNITFKPSVGTIAQHTTVTYDEQYPLNIYKIYGKGELLFSSVEQVKLIHVH